MKDKKLRIEDALSATKAAVEEGIVAGGGVALINAIPAVKALLDTVSGDEKTGVNIVLKALEAPIKQIAFNAGLEGSVIIDKIVNSGKVNYGFDAYNENYTDMIDAGIVDPTKVTRSALENAASVAAMVLTTESLVADKKRTPPLRMQPLLPPHRRAECIDLPFCIILELFAIKGAAVLRQPLKKQPECRFLVIRLLFYLYKKVCVFF